MKNIDFLWFLIAAAVVQKNTCRQKNVLYWMKHVWNIPPGWGNDMSLSEKFAFAEFSLQDMSKIQKSQSFSFIRKKLIQIWLLAVWFITLVCCTEEKVQLLLFFNQVCGTPVFIQYFFSIVLSYFLTDSHFCAACTHIASIYALFFSVSSHSAGIAS